MKVFSCDEKRVARHRMLASILLGIWAIGCTSDRVENFKQDAAELEWQGLEKMREGIRQASTAQGLSTTRDQPSSWRRVLPWGQAAGEVRLQPRGFEQVASGPSSVAVDALGRVLVLDRWNRRVIAISKEGSEITNLGEVPEHAETLAAGVGGAWVWWSPYRAVAGIETQGKSARTIPVPRILRETERVVLGASNQLWLENAHQERFLLGSPSALQSLSAVLRSKQEGVFEDRADSVFRDDKVLWC